MLPTEKSKQYNTRHGKRDWVERINRIDRQKNYTERPLQLLLMIANDSSKLGRTKQDFVSKILETDRKIPAAKKRTLLTLKTNVVGTHTKEKYTLLHPKNKRGERKGKAKLSDTNSTPFWQYSREKILLLDVASRLYRNSETKSHFWETKSQQRVVKTQHCVIWY